MLLTVLIWALSFAACKGQRQGEEITNASSIDTTSQEILQIYNFI